MSSQATSSQRRSQRHVSSINYDENSSSSSEESDANYNVNSSNRSRKRQKVSSTRKKIPDNIDKLDDFEENYIFQALSSEETAIGELATSWLEDFNDEETQFNALKDFINFILRSVGCVSQLSQHDVINVDSASDTIGEVQQLFEKQTYHEYPLNFGGSTAKNSNNSTWKDFKKNCLEFMSQLLLVANENGMLYDKAELTELLLTWLGAVSTSNIRPLRYASTLFCLEIEHTFCRIIVNLSKFIEKYKRQLKTEENALASAKNSKKKNAKLVKSINKRINQIKENTTLYQDQKNFLETFVKDVFDSIFAHRYRDVDPHIRKECVHYLSVWIDELPEFFLDSIYVRHFGWLLTDQDSSVRSEVFKILIKLYQKQDTVTTLRQFTSHFKSKMIEIAIFETDFVVRYNALCLLIEITKKGFLEDDEIYMVSGLIFVDSEDAIYHAGIKHNPSKIKKEIAKFIAFVETDKSDEFIDNHKSTFDDAQDSTNLDLREMVKFRYLLDLLDQSYQYYLDNYSSNDTKKEKENSKLNKFGSISEILYQLPRYNSKHESLEFLTDYLLFDISSIDDLDSELKDEIELNSKQQLLLLNFLYGATLNYTDGGEYTKVGTKTTNADFDVTSYLSKVISKLGDLYESNSKNNDNFSAFLLLFNELLTKGKFGATNQDGVLNKLGSSTIKSFNEIELPLLSVSSKDASYYDSLNYQYLVFFKNLSRDSAEITMKLEESVKFLQKTLQSNLIDDDVTLLAPVLNKMLILGAGSSNDKIIESLSLYIQDICEATTKSSIIDFDNDIAVLYDFFLYYISSNLELLLKSLNGLTELDTEDDINRKVATHMNRFKFIISTLQEILKDRSPSTELKYQTSLALSDILTSISYFKFYIDSSDNLNKFFEALDSFVDSTVNLKLTSSTQNLLLKTFQVKEYQVAELQGNSDKLDREETEDVNFTQYSVLPDSLSSQYHNDSDDEVNPDNIEEKKDKLKTLEIQLCNLTARLIVLSQIGLVDKTIVSRIELNKDLLGSLFIGSLKLTEPPPPKPAKKGRGRQHANAPKITTQPIPTATLAGSTENHDIPPSSLPATAHDEDEEMPDLEPDHHDGQSNGNEEENIEKQSSAVGQGTADEIELEFDTTINNHNESLDLSISDA